MADIHKIGYEKYCLHLDRISRLVKEKIIVTDKTFVELAAKANGYTNEIERDVTREYCLLGRKLLYVMNETGLAENDMKVIMDSKDFLYRTFFKPDYEPLIDEFEK